MSQNKSILASASQYFVVLKVDNTTSTDGIFWKNSTSIPTNDINITPTPSYYSLTSFNGTAWAEQSGVNYNMVVTAVPEPSTSILGAIGVMTMAYVAKRKRRSIAWSRVTDHSVWKKPRRFDGATSDRMLFLHLA